MRNMLRSAYAEKNFQSAVEQPRDFRPPPHKAMRPPSQVQAPQPKREAKRKLHEKERFPLGEAKARLLSEWFGWDIAVFSEAVGLLKDSGIAANSSAASAILMEACVDDPAADPIFMAKTIMRSRNRAPDRAQRISESRAFSAAFSAAFGWRDRDLRRALVLLGAEESLAEAAETLLIVVRQEMAESGLALPEVDPLAAVEARLAPQ